MKTRALAQKIIIVNLLPASFLSLREKEEYCLKKKNEMKHRTHYFGITEAENPSFALAPRLPDVSVTHGAGQIPPWTLCQHSHGAPFRGSPWSFLACACSQGGLCSEEVKCRRKAGTLRWRFEDGLLGGMSGLLPFRRETNAF